MKTPRTLQTKRVRPKAGFRLLHAATKKRKQRAATATGSEDLGEVPGVGVPLALVVILLLHIAAIAGIWIHDQWSESADLKATKVPLKENEQPARMEALDFHLVSKGDTLESIAARHGVDPEALAKVNEGKTSFEAGWKINLPPQRIPSASPSEPIVANIPSGVRVGIAPESRPYIQTGDSQPIPGSRPGEGVQLGGPEPISPGTESAVLISPVSPVRVDARPSVPTTARAQGRRHVVRSGETLWRIAHNNGVSVDALKRANPNVNVNALKIGASLVIPQSR